VYCRPTLYSVKAVIIIFTYGLLVFVRVMGPLGNDSPYTTAVVTTAGFRALI